MGLWVMCMIISLDGLFFKNEMMGLSMLFLKGRNMFMLLWNISIL